MQSIRRIQKNTEEYALLDELIVLQKGSLKQLIL